jgi:ParB/RepB/Spo0J family partition protein
MKVGKMPTLKWLKVDDIRIPEGRLRSYIEGHEDFEESIKAEGVIQPIYVFEEEGQNGKPIYWLADGGNRLEVAKRQDRPIIQAYVLHGSEDDALLYSAKLNVHRGKVNVGELAEFVKRLKDRGMKVEEIADSLRLSKGYVSELLAVAENGEILEKLKKGFFSLREAYKSLKSSFAEPISQETRHEKPTEITTVGQKPEVSKAETSTIKTQQTSKIEHTGLPDEIFQPIGPEKRDLRDWNCAYCGSPFTKLDSETDNVRWIPVHKHEKSLALDVLEKARAEREAQNESPQP